MASGFFTGDKHSEKEVYLYCEWESVPNYATNTSDVALSVYLRYTTPLMLEEGQVVVDMLANYDARRVFETLSVSEGGSGSMRTRFLGREEWKGIKHGPDGLMAVCLSAEWHLKSEPQKQLMYASRVVQLDTIPQVPPVLESRQVKNIGKDTATLTMLASHSLGIRDYTFSINGETRTVQDGVAVFYSLTPNTQYIASFRATSNNGLSTRTATEIFKTEPLYVSGITPSLSPIYENETKQLEVVITPQEASIKDLQYTSSNPRIATVSSTGLVRGVSKGTCKINIRSTDGSSVTASILVNVKRPVKYVYISNQQIQLPVNTACRIACSVYPETASEKTLSFSSSDSAVATVTGDGIVTAHKEGEAVITVTPDGRLESAEDHFDYTCIVRVTGKNSLAWHDLISLPQGGRWDYQIPAAVNTNLLYIWDKLVHFYGYSNMDPLESIDFSKGFGTNIREIKNKINALERNLDVINAGIAWVSPLYGEHREYHEATPERGDINRWIQFCADIKYIIDDEKERLAFVSVFWEPLMIRVNDELQYLCIREEI